jgi:hypothetical protein
MPAEPTGSRDATLAASRLRHDLGKAVRFSAPEDLEPDTGELRARLARDVAATRPGRSAAEIFDAWSAEFAHLFGEGPGADSLRRLERAMEETRVLAGRLEGLSRPELERLDALTRAIASECRQLAAAFRGPEGA